MNNPRPHASSSQASAQAIYRQPQPAPPDQCFPSPNPPFPATFQVLPHPLTDSRYTATMLHKDWALWSKTVYSVLSDPRHRSTAHNPFRSSKTQRKWQRVRPTAANSPWSPRTKRESREGADHTSTVLRSWSRENLGNSSPFLILT